MKKILFINHTSNISGAERSLLEILSCLDKSRWQPIVIAPPGLLINEIDKLGIEYITEEFPELKKPVNILDLFQIFIKLQKSKSNVLSIINDILPDVIHANTTRAMMLTPKTTIPVIWHIRDFALPCIITRSLYANATRIAVISDYIENDYIRKMRVNSSKFFYLPPSVDTDIFVPGINKSFRDKHCLPADVPLIGMVAQFVDWKRHHLFLDALENISSRPWHAVLAGATFNSNDEYMQSIADRLKLPPLLGRVNVINWVDNCQEFYQAIDISVLTSKNEPFGRVVIESMACGVPVVAVDEGGPREIIRKGDTGMLVESNAIAIASAINYLLDNQEKIEKMTTEARKYVIDNYNQATMKERLDIIYSELTCC